MSAPVEATDHSPHTATTLPDPTLVELARGGSRWAKLGFVVLAIGVIIALLSLTLLRPGKPVGGGGSVRIDGTPSYSLQYARGELKIASQSGGGVVFVDARPEDQGSQLVITPLQLPDYKGSPTGALPLVADEVRETVATRFDPGSVRFQDEGLVNVGAEPGYQLAYVARRNGETWFGRAVVAVKDVDGERGALLMDGQEERSDRIVGPRAVGRQGDLRRPMRTLSFD